MADNPRIEELRRRVDADPASIAFAALAEEYRRSGAYHDAIDTCRTGLQRHPSYLSARVTLGRALIEVGDYEGARQELEIVLKSAPENLAAIRAMSDIQERTGRSQAQPAPESPQSAPPAIDDWNLPPAPAAAPPPATEPAAVARPAAPRAAIGVAPSPPPPPAEPPATPVLGRLEALLASIQAARDTDRTSR